MKPATFTTGRILFVIAFLGLSLFLVSWDLKHSSRNYPVINDTTPDKPSRPAPPEKPKKITDLDDALDEFSDDLKMEMEKAQKELTEALKQIDKDKIRLEIDRAKMDIDKALKEVDLEKIRKEVEGSVAKIDWDKIKKEMDEVKKIDLDKVKEGMKEVEEQLKKIGPELEKEIEKAKVEIEKGKIEIREYKEFINGLEKDGLLNKTEPYTISHKNGELIVNGKTVSPEIYNRYKVFLEKNKEFTINKSADNLNIDKD
jgi:hypothetical protein